MNIEGQTRLELLRDGKVVKRIEKHNTITGWVGDALSSGNFFNQVQASKIYPLSQWFSGCLLTSGENNAELSMLAGNVDIIAQAGNDAYSGAYTKRGTFNTTESGSGVNNGKCFIRNVWDWATSQGNGTISSICLTRGELGKVEMNTNSVLADNAPVFESIGGSFTISETLRRCQIIDYDNEKAYKVTYSSGTITITEYALINTKRIHLFGGLLDVLGTGTEHTISQELTGFSYRAYSLHYDATNGTISLFGVTNGGANLYEYEIDISDWTCTATTHTYNGANFTEGISYENYLKLDKFPVIGNYIYCFSDNASKISKCNLSSTDIQQSNNPLYTIYGSYAIDENWVSGVSLVYPNGDWLKLDGRNTNYTLYYHNGVYYAVKGITGSLQRYSLVLTTGGTVLSVVDDTNASQLLAPFPYVSTVNNISAVTKEASMTMKLTYTITETSGS